MSVEETIFKATPKLSEVIETIEAELARLHTITYMLVERTPEAIDLKVFAQIEDDDGNIAWKSYKIAKPIITGASRVEWEKLHRLVEKVLHCILEE